MTAESLPSMSFLDGIQLAEGLAVEDEEFPSNVSSDYDRLLQPSGVSVPRPLLRAILIIVGVLVLALPVYFLRASSKVSVAAPASHSSTAQ